MPNLTPVAGYDPVLQLETSTRVLGGPGGPANSQAQSLINNIEQLKNDRATSDNPVLTGTVTIETIVQIPGNPAEGPGGNAFNGGILTHKTSGNYQVSAYQVQPTLASLKPEWGPIAEYVACGTTDQSTNFWRISLTCMAPWAGPALNDAANDIRLQQEAGGTEPVRDFKITAQYNTTGRYFEYINCRSDGNVWMFRRLDADAPTGDQLELALDNQKRATINALISNGVQASPSLRFGAISYNGSFHTASWYWQAVTTTNAGASKCVLSTRLDAGSRIDYLSVNDAGIIGDIKGIQFPSSPTVSANANTLYAVNMPAWFSATPVSVQLQFGGANVGLTTSISTIIYDQLNGEYRFVIAIRLTALGTSTGNATISGLPFSAVNVADISQPCLVTINNKAAAYTALAAVAPGTSVITLQKDGATITNLTNADLTNTSVIRISGTIITT